MGMDGEIKPQPMEALMTIIRANDFSQSQHAQAVRDGIADALAGDRLLQLVGEFHFGDDGDFPRETVVVPSGLVISGMEGTKIIGGGAKARTPAWGVDLAMDGGAFKVSSGGRGGGSQKVTISNIAFSGWKCVAILVDSCDGLTIQDCSFMGPSSGVIDGFNAPDGTPIQNVNAVWAIGTGCNGKFHVSNNACDLSEYATDSAAVDDEQFLACFATDFEQVLVDGNSIVGNDDGIEVVFNNLRGILHPQVHIQISNNSLTLAHQLRTRWMGSGGIVCCRNDGAKVDIVDNTVKTTGTMGAGMVLTGSYLQGSARKMTVTGNRIDQSADATSPHFAGAIMGYDLPFGADFPGSYAPEKIGASLSGAVIKDNQLSGTTSFGYVTLDGGELKLPQCLDGTCEPNHSHHILIEDYGPISGQYKLYLSCGTHDIEVRGNFEPYFICNPDANRVIVGEAVAASPRPQSTPA
jgi:hypothetical protein